MFDVALHVGTEHPNLLWLGAASLLSFGAGLGLGLYAGPELADDEPKPVSEPSER